jgi:hypothetical protein
MSELADQVLEFLTKNPKLGYSVDELVEQFKSDRVTMGAAVSKLYDQRKVRLKVVQRKVYAGVR